MVKKVIKDPFMGEIELTKMGEISKHMVGESRIDTIYTDERGNYWIDTWSTSGGVYVDPIPMIFLRKELIETIIEIHG